MVGNALRFTRTTDSGDTWSPAVLVHDPGPTAVDFSGHVLILPSGDLLAVWAHFDVVSGLGTLMASRSTDEGGTWGTAGDVAGAPGGQFAAPGDGGGAPP